MKNISLRNPEDQKYYEASQSQKIFFIRNFYKQKDLVNINNVLVFDIEDLDLRVLKKAIKHLINRHSIFKSTLVCINGTIKQRISKNCPIFKIEVIKLKEIENKDEVFKEFVKNFYKTKFRYDRSPWMSVKLISFESNYHKLLIAVPHMIVDIHSIDILKKDMCSIYQSLLQGDKINMSQTLQFNDYTSEVNAILRTKGEVHKKYWMDLFKDQAGRNLSSCYSTGSLNDNKSYSDLICNEIKECTNHNPERVKQDFLGTLSYLQYRKGNTYIVSLGEKQLEVLKSLSKKSFVSLSVVIIATFYFLLYKLTGEHDITTGINATTRNRKELNNVVGFFINTLFLRYKFKDSINIIEFMRKLNIKLLESFTHVIYPHEKILYDIDTPLHRIASLFLNILNKENVINNRVNIDPIHIQNIVHPYFDIDCHISIFKNLIEIQCKYRTEVFSISNIEYFFLTYFNLIDNLEFNSDLKISQLMLPVS